MEQATPAAAHATAARDAARTLMPPLHMQPTISSCVQSGSATQPTRSLSLHAHQCFMSLVRSMQYSCCTRNGARHGFTDQFRASKARAFAPPVCLPPPRASESSSAQQHSEPRASPSLYLSTHQTLERGTALRPRASRRDRQTAARTGSLVTLQSHRNLTAISPQSHRNRTAISPAIALTIATTRSRRPETRDLTHSLHI
jgi:hypothetical protein